MLSHKLESALFIFYCIYLFSIAFLSSNYYELCYCAVSCYTDY